MFPVLFDSNSGLGATFSVINDVDSSCIFRTVSGQRVIPHPWSRIAVACHLSQERINQLAASPARDVTFNSTVHRAAG